MIDLLYRAIYRMAYRLMRVYWALFHPRTHGALVAVWHDGEVLLVRNSYTRYHSFPGGYVRHGEAGREAARRELREEVGIQVELSQLEPVLDEQRDWEGKRDRVEVFELSVAARPAVCADNREVVEAGFYPPAQALALDLFPAARAAIERKVRGSSRA
jgi:8-oxo-dGTP diphosphatase